MYIIYTSSEERKEKENYLPVCFLFKNSCSENFCKISTKNTLCGL